MSDTYLGMHINLVCEGLVEVAQRYGANVFRMNTLDESWSEEEVNRLNKALDDDEDTLKMMREALVRFVEEVVFGGEEE